MARMVTTKQAALARARERRLALDAQREVRDRRVEQLTADALLLLEHRAGADAVLAQTSAALGTVLRQLLAEQIGVDGVAALLELDPSEVRRLTRAAQPAGAPPPDADAVRPTSSDGAATQAARGRSAPVDHESVARDD